MAVAPGVIRDAITSFLANLGTDASTNEITSAVKRAIGDAPSSSVRSYLSLNTPTMFERTGRGRYRLAFRNSERLTASRCSEEPARYMRSVRIGAGTLFNTDCFDWLASCAPATIQGVVTDPPYGLVEYSSKETTKLRSGKGGVWRVPPSFDGHVRSPLPRFTVLTEEDRRQLFLFFKRFGALILRATVPGANIVIASNPLLSHIVADAMSQSGLELRGYISRQVMTMRGGDRPKNAHEEFRGVSVMPRSQWEPWVVLRKPLDGRVQDNLRRWKTGGFRRPSSERPFGDVIRSSPTPAGERKIAPHPSLKPQDFMRQLVHAVLPLGEGVVLDPFMGAGSTIAAANAVGYESIGLELDRQFFDLATAAVPKLASLPHKQEALQVA